MIIERKVGSQIVRADCSQAYARAANSVLNEFEKLAGSGKPLKAGTKIRFGWTLLHLIDYDTSLLITEPDFVNWPQEGWSRTIDTSLEVLTAQVSLLHRLDVDTEDAYFDQFMITTSGGPLQPRIFMRRESSISSEDSGWLLGSVEDPEALARESGLERIAIASLVSVRRSLLQAITLPPGFIVTYSGDSIEQIFDAGGRQRL